MASLPLTRVTPEEYLERERSSDTKHEYWDGEIFAMAGGSPAHSFIINNSQTSLTNRLRGKQCYVFNADLRVAAAWPGLITYPDATVVCGMPSYVDDRLDTITNPTLVVEVLSPSIAQSDRGEKAFRYRQTASMREILLVEPEPVFIEHYWKLPNGHWELETVTQLSAVLQLPSIACELPAAEIYRDVEIFARLQASP